MDINLLAGLVHIHVDEDSVASWSHDERTGIYTINLADGSTCKYESKVKKFYVLQDC